MIMSASVIDNDPFAPKKSQQTPVLQAYDLSKQVAAPGNQQQALIILKKISFSILSGESVAIMGASGSGKSTLLALLAGLDMPSSGFVAIDGMALNKLDEEGRAKVRLEKIGFIFQSFHLLPGLSALENVMLPLELKGVRTAKVEAQNWLERVGLKLRMNHFPRQLSGGEQQRVAIARAFVIKPKLLLADEPTGSLDSMASKMISNLLFDLNTSLGTTLILVSHNMQLAERCQRVAQLQAGAIARWEK